MKQALLTSYVKATGKRGSRIKVTGGINSAMYPFDSAISVEENHAVAAGHYVYEMNKMRGGDGRVWTITDGGSTPDTNGYAFIITLGTV
ncbi:hypothetical protein uav_010 [Pseudomonas phage UAVern]|uniref:Uncharacterized protein n=1 Tax=Pseudomonas phage UAVern TaxID=2856997 RepID=A0A975UU58_9CAUD|nr:hypothetical protein uav_010 [Pseudomonas phage UAVern]